MVLVSLTKLGCQSLSGTQEKIPEEQAYVVARSRASRPWWQNPKCKVSLCRDRPPPEALCKIKAPKIFVMTPANLMAVEKDVLTQVAKLKGWGKDRVPSAHALASAQRAVVDIYWEGAVSWQNAAAVLEPEFFQVFYLICLSGHCPEGLLREGAL